MVDVIVESSVAPAFTPIMAIEPTGEATAPKMVTVVTEAEPLSTGGLAIDSKRIGDANPCHTIQKSHTTAEFKLVKKKRPRAKSTKLTSEQGYSIVLFFFCSLCSFQKLRRSLHIPLSSSLPAVAS